MADKDGKNFSLRHKKSKRVPISAPKPISAPVSNAAPRQPSASSSTRTPTRPNVNGRTDTSENTADLVKRRYSTRFIQPPDFTSSEAPPVPTIPDLSNAYAGVPTQNRPHTADRSHKVPVDVKALKDPNLKAEQYATALLSEASDQEIRDYQASLRKLKNRASTDLQQNVYQNRSQFIKISKEAEKLKSEMRTLRGLMSELTSSFSQASVHAGVPEPSVGVGATPSLRGEDVRSRARKNANRSSVANLEAMWNVQLHTLWKNVEGSQKFLPAIPGRHVVLEQSNWLELDAATWKARRHAHLFLLNDHLMIATRRKKRVDPGALTNGNEDAAGQKTSVTRLVADKCWPLQDIDMIDIASAAAGDKSNSMSNAISIRCGHESFTYRSDRSSASDKSNLLLAFRRTVDELRKLQRVDMDEKSSKTKETIEYLAARDPALSDKPDLLNSLSDSKRKSDIMIEVEGKHHNLRWVDGQIDDLDSEIALQRFEDAVRHVEKLRRLAKGLKGNMIAQDLITTKVDERAKKLADILTRRLATTHSALSLTQKNIAHLNRLSYSALARSTYLDARTGTINQRARQIMFEGDLLLHISQLSYVYFALIRNTVRVYQQCFPPPMMSACVKWAKERLDDFNDLLGRQLGSVVPESKTWLDCLARAKEHAGMCGEIGMDFVELVRVGRGSVVIVDEQQRQVSVNGDHGDQ